MKRGAALQAVSALPMVRAPVRALSGVIVLGALMLLLTVGTVLMASHGGVPLQLVAVAGGFTGYVFWVRAGSIRCNRGIALLHRGDLDGATRELAAMLPTWAPSSMVALALDGLAQVALRRREFGAAIALLRGALVLRREAAIVEGLGSPTASIRARLALALVCDGDVDGARALLDTPLLPTTSAFFRAQHLRSEALVEVRRGRFERALHLLDDNRRLLRNAILGSDVSLVEVAEAVALRALGGRFKGQTRPVAPVPVDPEARELVLAALPGCEELLTDELS